MSVGKVGTFKHGQLSVGDVLKVVRASSGGKAGAIGCFIGVVREGGLKGGKVLRLEYEACGEDTERALEKIRQETMEKLGLVELAIHHAVGEVPVGEETIYVVAAGKHRREVIEGLREVVDRVKAEVPIWKKEVTSEGAYWVGSKRRH